MNDLIDIQQVDGFGKAVVAKVPLSPGQLGLEVLREKALIVFPTWQSHLPDATGEDGPPRWILRPQTLFNPKQIWSDYKYFQKQPKDIQDRVLNSFFAGADLDGDDTGKVLDFVKDMFDTADEATVFTKLVMVIKFNSVRMQPVNQYGSGPGKDYGHALLDVTCRLAHSCRPNCIWFTAPDGQSKIVRLVSPVVHAGEMLTISYLDHELLEQPMYIRRQILKRTKNFDCRCTRCEVAAIDGDDSRVIPCYERSCDGHHFVHQFDNTDEPRLMACTTCSRQAPLIFQSRVLEEEKEVLDEITFIDRVLNFGLPVDVTTKVRIIQPPHPLHGVALRFYRTKKELYEQLGLFTEAIEAQRKWIECRLKIHGDRYCDEQTGFSYEHLGDLLVMNGDLQEACHAFQKSVQTLQISRGGSTDPYTKCAMVKLTNVQKQLPPSTISLSLGSRGTTSSPTTNPPNCCCGLCGQVATHKCARCKTAVYCNRDHQLNHWKVHKKSCNK